MSVDAAQLRIVTYPAASLRERGVAVDADSEEVRIVARRMIDLMHEANGVGLAAPQVGLAWRLFVTNGGEVDPVDRVFINPELELGRGELVTAEEGCLSLPDIHVNVRRPDAARIRAIDLDGKAFTMDGEGMLARIWQHEFDHLNAVLIVDRMSPMDRLTTRRALKELESAARAVR
ncbi:MAG: peptide deformylase [Phycisphaerales bacterium]|nr:peptide deformylase [Phycisphaerae bacterium]NNF42759.1 peptide deformylase [Phycisphaerales bacterium]NNM25853.1 peptide deformylase [Phycisphaerales bacterium]